MIVFDNLGNAYQYLCLYDNDGHLHCEDGPALVTPYGKQKWYWHGRHFKTEEEWLAHKFVAMVEENYAVSNNT